MDFNIQNAIISIIPFMFAVSIHEAAHAFVANYLGDPTAKMQGRLSLNPIVHADIYGTVIFPLLGFAMGGFLFGWAKPVPVNERNLRWKKYGMFAVALAGPLVNIFLAAICCTALVLLNSYVAKSHGFFEPIKLMLEAGLIINIALATFNLIPLPPLDGYKIVEPFLSYEFKQKIRPLEAYSSFILIGLMLTGILRYLFIPGIIATRIFENFLYTLV